MCKMLLVQACTVCIIRVSYSWCSWCAGGETTGRASYSVSTDIAAIASLLYLCCLSVCVYVCVCVHDCGGLNEHPYTHKLLPHAHTV